ncbi:dGTPase [Couchioplanes caeruleus subsp. azureus]|nr:dGTPase [Couchioplanes caeruleus subsp. azureus]
MCHEAARDGRRWHQDPSPTDARTEGMRDRDRILYSSAWMRLTGVTQVVNHRPCDSILLHNRMTHSLRVAQVSRSIAEQLLIGDAEQDMERRDRLRALGGLDVDVAEAAGLAHDLGHAPFGPAGERILDEVARTELGLADGFSPHAQTLRIVSRLERKYQGSPGMDLTRATRAAILKYPWVRRPMLVDHDDFVEGDPDYRRHWCRFGAYVEDSTEISEARCFCADALAGEVQTLEASILDVADDISSAIHDLEDFLLARVVDVEAVRELVDDHSPAVVSLQRKLAGDYADYFDASLMAQALRRVRERLLRAVPRPFTGLADEIGQVRWHCSQLIGEYIADVHLAPGAPAEPHWPGGPFIGLGPLRWHEIQILKAISGHVITSRVVGDRQTGDKATLRLVAVRLAELLESDPALLPDPMRRMLRSIDQDPAFDPDGSLRRRLIPDFLCGLTDSQVDDLFDWLYGRQARSAKPRLY